MNKYDFAGIIVVRNANPNGDPVNGNRPRINYDGYGEISDVCLKRKIRNRLQDMGSNIFVQSDGNSIDGYKTLRDRAEKELKQVSKEREKYAASACVKWIDVRSFGQVFAFSGKDDKGVSVGVRGPVSIHPAFSINTINTTSTQITKSVSSEGDGTKKTSDTIGIKHRVDFGVYVFYGSINPQLAIRTGFNAQDAEHIKKALATLFVNDASSARPEGSMEMHRLYWWEHNSQIGQYSAAKVHRSLHIVLKEGVITPSHIQDYSITVDRLDGLSPEIIEGE